MLIILRGISRLLSQNNKIMTLQAKNCLELYLGGNPNTIKSLLQQQKSSVVIELKNYFGVYDIDKLAICLSLGKISN